MLHFIIAKQLNLQKKIEFLSSYLVYEKHITQHFMFWLDLTATVRMKGDRQRKEKGRGTDREQVLFFMKRTLCFKVWIYQDCVSSATSRQVTHIVKFSYKNHVLLQIITKGRNTGGWTVNEGFTMKLSGLEDHRENGNFWIRKGFRDQVNPCIKKQLWMPFKILCLICNQVESCYIHNFEIPSSLGMLLSFFFK